MFKRHAQLKDEEDEPDLESLVRAELSEALQSAAVRQQLVAALDVRSAVAAGLAVERPQLLASLAASLDLDSRLAALVRDPRTTQHLAAHIDLAALLAGPGLRDHVRASLASSDLVEYLERSVPAAAQRLQRRLVEDAASRSAAALAAGSWALAGVACWLYAALAFELCLVVFGWLLQLAFLRTSTFAWAWLTLPVHTVRAAAALALSRRVPSIEAAIAAACEPPDGPRALHCSADAAAAVPTR